MPKKPKSPSPKRRAKILSDPEAIVEAIRRGKYRDEKAHFERRADGTLWLEIKE